jgi:hypothetical protein
MKIKRTLGEKNQGNKTNTRTYNSKAFSGNKIG